MFSEDACQSSWTYRCFEIEFSTISQKRDRVHKLSGFGVVRSLSSFFFLFAGLQETTISYARLFNPPGINRHPSLSLCSVRDGRIYREDDTRTCDLRRS